MQLKETLSSYKYWCNEIAGLFAKKYFCGEGYTMEDIEMWWVAARIGGTLAINDYFFNMEDMVLALDWHVPEGKLFGYYNYALTKKCNSLYSYLHHAQKRPTNTR